MYEPPGVDSVRPLSRGLLNPSWISWAPQRGRSEVDDQHVGNGAGTATTQPYETLCLAEYVCQCYCGTSGGGTENGCCGVFGLQDGQSGSPSLPHRAKRLRPARRSADSRATGTHDGVRISRMFGRASSSYPGRSAGTFCSFLTRRRARMRRFNSHPDGTVENGGRRSRWPFQLLPFKAVQKRPICPRRGCRGFEGCHW